MGSTHDFDWLVIGSGFGGSVSALRLTEKGYSVGVIESGRRFADDELPKSTWDLRRYFFAPRLGMRGIFRLSIFKDVTIAQRRGRGRWVARLREHALPRARALLRGPPVGRARVRLGRRPGAALRRGGAHARRHRGAPPTTPPTSCCASSASEIGAVETYAKTRVGVYFGEPGVTVEDPFFGGDGPAAHRLRGVRALHGRLPARREEHAGQELPLARRAAGAEVMPERTVVDVRPLGPRGRQRRLRGRHGAHRRLAAQATAGRTRRGGGRRRRGGARHQQAARSAAACAAGCRSVSRPARRARAHELRGDPRRHAPAGPART